MADWLHRSASSGDQQERVADRTLPHLHPPVTLQSQCHSFTFPDEDTEARGGQASLPTSDEAGMGLSCPLVTSRHRNLHPSTALMRVSSLLVGWYIYLLFVTPMVGG